MRTKFLNRFKKRLASVNNQLCYHFFASEQARPGIDEAASLQPEKNVSASFPENSFSSRIDIRNRLLPGFHKVATETLGGIALVSGVECVLSHLDEIQDFRAELAPTIVDTFKHDKAEEKISHKLASWGAPPSLELTKTLAYLRLRRNHIAHANQDPHPSLKAVTAQYGNLLTNYWAQQPASLPDLQFTSKNYLVRTEKEAFSLINICRIVMEEYDGILCSTIPQSTFEAFELKKFITANKAIRGHKIETRLRKFSAQFRQNYGTEVTMTCDELSRAWAGT